MRPALFLRLALTGCLLTLAGAACSGGTPAADSVEVAGQSVPAGQLSAVVEAVCRAAGEAPAAPVAAGQTFFGQAHDRIHFIARALEGVDRGRAANLLVAKQAVEADIASRADGPKLAADLKRLAGATRTGLGRLGVAVPACANPPRPPRSTASG